MLVELTVRNFAVIEETRLSLGDGFNVITGETGAGKSLLVDALAFVLGGPADQELIRAGAETASVEAVFAVDHAAAPHRLPPTARVLAGHGLELDDEGTVVIARETHRGGRSVSRLNGRAVPVAVAKDVGETLVDIHGQGAHLSLLSHRHQLAMLDAWAGLEGEHEAFADGVDALRTIERELAGLVTDDRQAAQQRDLLAFQATEIESAQLRPGEGAKLIRERDLLANANAIREACAAAYDTLYAGSSNACDLMAEAVQALARSVDPAGALALRIAELEAAAAQVEEAAREIRTYADTVEADPAQLETVDDRIELIRRLQRKYGDTELAIIAFGEQASRDLEGMENAAERHAELDEAVAQARERLGVQAGALSAKRLAAAKRLAVAVAAELGELGLGGVEFEASLARADDHDGLAVGGRGMAFTRDGIDRVEYLVETNSGEGLRPLARIASGGETSRLMLAIKSALATGSGITTMVFDEVDSGVGGRAGDVLGRKLWSLAQGAQVLCVTHLAQVAAYADRHFRVDKGAVGDRTFATVERLGADDLAQELSSMLGGASDSLQGAATEMLAAAGHVKAQATR
jgi:DNA repair protein RecN (Recombination protein N)